ncbi:5-dehydro-4-deoxyglucarate dehydratase [Rhizobium sp. S153]|uniref:Probable 5-dehydro-4-deoxyglucarate dehydratase n=1 Tax=Ciceribacter sichuanensis TaxID=2949647 RepID=A0ABT0VC41_9HYPH|nr:5-dehydro-4-deoxyglucarate dehydratase [Ciceribacter sp. S153]MCM2402070.1 5-dehydro-4-deoxyglucarate dehydratase [Ciceribacter sp. S153]
MSRMTPQEMAGEISKGLLSFPVTHFNKTGAFQPEPFRDHLEWLTGFGPATFFAACGTGEFFSLSPAEVETVTRVAIDQMKGRVPVIAGVGYGTSMAVEMAARAEAAGADGLLVLPPYLITPESAGLEAHVEAICASTKLGVTIYNRDNAILDEYALARLAERCPNLVGYKDGVGDVELMVRIQSLLEGRLTFIGGLPTAETFALPYLDMGVNTYSSAIFNFVPQFAMDFHAAVLRRDHAAIMQGLRNFVLPYIEIRSRRRGYAVSIVKAGLRAMGRDAGPVRSPLVDLTEAEMSELTALIEGIETSAPLSRQPADASA